MQGIRSPRIYRLIYEKVSQLVNLDNLEGSWEKVYSKGLQDAELVIWSFSDDFIPEREAWKILTIYVSDVFAGDSEAKYIYIWHQNGYPGVGSSTPELYLFEIDHDTGQRMSTSLCGVSSQRE